MVLWNKITELRQTCDYNRATHESIDIQAGLTEKYSNKISTADCLDSLTAKGIKVLLGFISFGSVGNIFRY